MQRTGTAEGGATADGGKGLDLIDHTLSVFINLKQQAEETRRRIATMLPDLHG